MEVIIDMNLSKLVADLKASPNFKMPNPEQALLFLTSEVGEAADALSSTWNGYVRSEEHNALCQPEVRLKVAAELADVVIMASVAMAALGVNPDEALQKKFTELVERFS